jgi:hypothetical protein
MLPQLLEQNKIDFDSILDFAFAYSLQQVEGDLFLKDYLFWRTLDKEKNILKIYITSEEIEEAVNKSIKHNLKLWLLFGDEGQYRRQIAAGMFFTFLALIDFTRPKIMLKYKISNLQVISDLRIKYAKKVTTSKAYQAAHYNCMSLIITKLIEKINASKQEL